MPSATSWERNASQAVRGEDLHHYVRHEGDRPAVRGGCRRPVRLDARRSHREAERGDVPPAGERTHPRAPPAPRGGRERKIRGRGRPPPKGRRNVPGSTHRATDHRERHADRFHGYDPPARGADETMNPKGRGGL